MSSPSEETKDVDMAEDDTAAAGGNAEVRIVCALFAMVFVY
jgi:hypothetical protein